MSVGMLFLTLHLLLSRVTAFEKCDQDNTEKKDELELESRFDGVRDWYLIPDVGGWYAMY
jgi:hypothetical protein